jgi:hypothetical protein
MQQITKKSRDGVRLGVPRKTTKGLFGLVMIIFC